MVHTKPATTIGVDQTLGTVAARLIDETDDLVETMLGRMRDEAPGFDVYSRPELAEGLRASCYGNVRVALQSLGGDREPPRNAPAEALHEARATARAEVGLEPLLHTYRIGHAVVLERFFTLLEDLDLASAQRHSATLIGSKYLFAYVDRVVGEVSEEYAVERQRVLRSSIQRRVQLVRDVLGGGQHRQRRARLPPRAGASRRGGRRLDGRRLSPRPGAPAGAQPAHGRDDRRHGVGVAGFPPSLRSTRVAGHRVGAGRRHDPVRRGRAVPGDRRIPREPRAGTRGVPGLRAPGAGA